MIFETILQLIVNFLVALIDLFPDVSLTIPDLSLLNTWLNWVSWLFPSGMLAAILVNVLAWKAFHLVYSPVKWTYKKIPGVS